MALRQCLHLALAVQGLAAPLAPGAAGHDEKDDRWAAFAMPGYTPQDSFVIRKADLPPLTVILALTQQNTDLLEEQARRVSDPKSSSYGRYLLRDEVGAIVRPTQEAIQVVADFLKDKPGNVTWSKSQDMAMFSCKVADCEATFGTKLKVHKGTTNPGDSPIRAATPIQFPEEVSRVLDGVSLNAPVFMPPKPAQKNATAFEYPASRPDKVPRINPTMIAGDSFICIKFVGYCADGSANTDFVQDGVCSSAGKKIVSFEVETLQGRFGQKVTQLPAISDLLSQSVARCGRTDCVQFNITVGNIENFQNTTARVRAVFEDGTITPFSPPTEVNRVFPLPYTTPEILAKYYGVPWTTPIRDPRNIISVAEFSGQYYNPVDLETFFRLMAVRSWVGEGKTQPRLVGENKPIAGSVLGGEAQLDIQYIMALSANVTTWFWSVSGTEVLNQEEPLLHWLMQVGDRADDDMPLVHSVSYADDEYTVPMWFKRRVNLEFAKLALRGVSILVAAGDDGAGGLMLRDDPVQACKQAVPMFPASSPWVTAVGGTMMSDSSTPVCGYVSDTLEVLCHVDGEVLCDADQGGGITAGGGFSNDFSRPWYQKEEIDRYLQQSESPLSPPDKWGYNVNGRAYPDISGMASNYLVWMGDHLETTSGTSASTPLLAAMISHLNEQRLKRKLPPLGFLNPLLYQMGREHPEAYNDVVVGNSHCGMTHCCGTESGFTAARGWDAATGFGSPKLDVFRQLLRPREENHPEFGFAASPRIGMPLPAAALAGFAAAAVLGWVANGVWRRRHQPLEQEIAGYGLLAA